MQRFLKLPLMFASPHGEVSDSFWASLRYFNLYRIAVAALFLLVVLAYRDTLNLGDHDLRLFVYCATAYLAAAVAFHAVLRRVRTHFNLQLTLHVVADIVALTLLMNASSGIRSGLGVMLLISLAGAALVSRGTLMLFYAALASIAVLLEQSYWVLAFDYSTTNFVQPGLLSIGYFATAMIINRLAQRVIMNERVARQRGEDLASQLRINQRVIQDVRDGVLVVDANGLVHQHNRQVSALLGREAPELAQVDEYSAELAAQLRAWRAGAGADTITLQTTESGRSVRARFVAAGLAGTSFSLVFMEDLSRLQEQAQQLKLAALGRLTANIAHEIRNPLSAITHAVDLLREENRAHSRARLAQIIRDNADRLDRMVRDVLELSKRDRTHPEPLRLKDFLTAFAEEFAQNESTGADVIAVSAPERATVRFDRVHLNQVLWNLARNACRHSSRAPGSVQLLVRERGIWIELEVTDDGEGVAKDLQQQLFEPFFTTFSGGTGLGLYIARELCEANGASLDYLQRSRGATFRILCQSPQ